MRPFLRGFVEELVKTGALKYTPVESSNLAAVGYDPKKKKLGVRFHGSGTYLYQAVPESVFDRLLHADSKGHAFNELVRKGGYAFERQGRKKKPAQSKKPASAKSEPKRQVLKKAAGEAAPGAAILQRAEDEGIHQQHVLQLARMAGVGRDDEPRMAALMARLTGKRHLDDMSEEELWRMASELQRLAIRRAG